MDQIHICVIFLRYKVAYIFPNISNAFTSFLLLPTHNNT